MPRKPAQKGPSDTRLVQRKGYILADGSRTEASQALRFTLLLDVTTGEGLELAAFKTKRTMSDIVNEAVAEWLKANKRTVGA